MFRQTLSIGWGFILIFASLVICQPSNQALVQFSDLQYLGAFKLPDAGGSDNTLTFNYAQGPVAFNPHQGGNSANPPSLFIGCFAGDNISEVNIPEPVISASSKLDELPTAVILQQCANPQQGASDTFAGGVVGGLLVWDAKLVFTYYNSFPAAGCWSVSHFVKNSLNLSAADATGGFVVNNTAGATCFVNGPMTWIPPEWQVLLGNNPAVTYNCCHSIIATTSWGPSAFAFSPSSLGPDSTNSVALQYYTGDHPTLGEYNSSSPLVFEPPWNNCWNAAAPPGYRGLVIPNGTRSALYFTAQGIGSYCYGFQDHCPDSAAPAIREHAYPYRFHIMAFDLNGWTAVAVGAKQPWEPVPYAVWPLVPPLPFTDSTSECRGGGAAYDPATRRIYWEQPRANNMLPIIHVWEVMSANAIASGTPADLATAAISAYPNPFNPTVKISVGAYGNIRMAVFDISGHMVADLTTQMVNGCAVWDASGLNSGVYVIRARIGNKAFAKQVTIIK